MAKNKAKSGQNLNQRPLGVIMQGSMLYAARLVIDQTSPGK